MIGYAFCGSFCTLSHSLAALRQLCADGCDILPIMSEKVYETDTRFWRAEDFRHAVRELCGRDIVHTIVDAEPLGPSVNLEALIISPCTGNTLAKIASGITDTAATMAAKAHLRADRPLLIALASNDALSQNLKNVAALLTRKSVCFVPMLEDNPVGKPHSLVAEFELIPSLIEKTAEGKQQRPIFLGSAKS